MGKAPFVAFTEPMVPLVEVLGSGRAVIREICLEEAKTPPVNSMMNSKDFITVAFIPFVMKKAGHAYPSLRPIAVHAPLIHS